MLEPFLNVAVSTDTYQLTTSFSSASTATKRRTGLAVGDDDDDDGEGEGEGEGWALLLAGLALLLAGLALLLAGLALLLAGWALLLAGLALLLVLGLALLEGLGGMVLTTPVKVKSRSTVSVAEIVATTASMASVVLPASVPHDDLALLTVKAAVLLSSSSGSVSLKLSVMVLKFISRHDELPVPNDSSVTFGGGGVGLGAVESKRKEERERVS